MIRAFQLQINNTLSYRLVILKMWEPMLWYHPLTLRLHGYGDATAMYICRADILSYMYLKYQYRQELEYKNTWHLYIPIKRV